MGKHKQFRDLDGNSDVPIWVKRINELIEDKQITQQILANKCNMSPSIISDWIGLNKKKNNVLREPRILGFYAIAKYFGVSVDYLLGENECQTPSDERIHEITGLSGIAIQQLRKVKKLQNKSIEAEKKILLLNYLLENMSESSLFVSLYNYLIGDFVFPGREDNQFGAFMLEHLPSGSQSKNIVFKDMFSQAAFIGVQHDIMRLKDKVMEEHERIQQINTVENNYF